MITSVEGIIISETPYGDTSKIINVFTKEYGVIGLICKGAMGIKSKLRVGTMKLTHGLFNIYYRSRSKLIEEERKICISHHI